ncbi:MAG: radical SAM protein [Pseudomonadota bacterium]
MPRPDVIFVRPPGPRETPGILSGIRALSPPSFLALLAGYVRGLGYSVEVMDARALNLSPERAAREVRGLAPLLCVLWVSALDPEESTPAMDSAGEMIAELAREEPVIPTLLGGLHPSALPCHTLEREKPDYVCQGQGFSTIPALLEALRGGQTAPVVPGLWLKQKAAPDSPPRVRAPAGRNLENLPLPAWDLLPMKQYRAPAWMSLSDPTQREPFATVLTSLGCPFSCGYCARGALTGRSGVLHRPPEKVADELEVLAKNYETRTVSLADPLFALDEKRVANLCKKIRERGLDMVLSARARPDTVTHRMLASMRSAGIRWMELEVDSADQRVLADAGRPGRQAPDRAMAAAAKEGVHVCGEFRLGLLEDDFASMNRSLAFMMENPASWVRVRPAMPFPGSKLYETALASGWPLPRDWAGFASESRDARHPGTRYLSGEQVLDFCDYARSAWFSNPAVRDRLGRNFGPKALGLAGALGRPQRNP